jgi:hypothetical protein
LRSPDRAVLLNAPLAQEPVHAQPGRPSDGLLQVIAGALLCKNFVLTPTLLLLAEFGGRERLTAECEENGARKSAAWQRVNYKRQLNRRDAKTAEK